MDVQAAIRDDGALSRVVATLIALAALAERSASRSCVVRCLVLLILRPAETLAREFVTGVTATPLPGIKGPETRNEIWNGPEDAILLASRFRALAAALGALILLARRFARWNARRAAVRFAPHSGRLPVTSGDWMRKPNDTS